MGGGVMEKGVLQKFNLRDLIDIVYRGIGKGRQCYNGKKVCTLHGRDEYNRFSQGNEACSWGEVK